MDFREIKKLVTLMNENGLTRLEVEEEGKRYLMEKGGGLRVESLAPALPAMGAAPMAASAFPAAGAPAPEAASAAREDTITFNSPMVGTFYRASSPDTPAFASPGDKIGPDSTLCIIEAMKVFNEIKAELSGTIVEVLAENQEAVEYNQPLFLIRPE